MRILRAFPTMTRRHKFPLHINPILVRHILHPPMSIPTMIDHNIHDGFDAFGLRFFRKFLEQCIRPKTRIHLVIICNRIAMITLFSLIIYLDRHIPNRRKAHVFHIVQLVHQALQITPMPIIQRRPIQGRFLHSFNHIIRWIAIRKTIRSHQINNVWTIETLALSGIGLAGKQRIFNRM